MAIAGAMAVVSADVAVSVDWSSQRYRISSNAVGLNGFLATNSDNTGNSTYINNLKYMLGEREGGGIFRIHTWEMMGTGENGWMGNDEGWNAEKVRQAVGDLVRAGINVCINIPASPGGDPSPENFGRFCAALVRIVNIDGGLGVKYWEIPNEREEAFGYNPHALADFYNAGAQAMKEVDPSIIIGGPALQYPHRTDEISTFVGATGSHLQFLSFHNYAGGGGQTDEQVWDNAGPGWIFDALKSMTNLPIWYDEFNVGWSWDVAQEQQHNMCGAVYDALSIARSLDHGAAVLCAWNEKDGSYGKMDMNNTFRPAAHSFHVFSHYTAGGMRVSTSSSNEGAVVPFAAYIEQEGVYSIVLINRTKANQTVQVSQSGANTSTFQVFQLNASGSYGQLGDISASALASGVTLPGPSVTVYTVPGTPPEPTPPEITAQPADIEVREGRTATVSASAKGSYPLTWEWFVNNSAVAGAAGSSLAITGIDMTYNGATVKATVTNEYGSVATQEATITVIEDRPYEILRASDGISVDGTVESEWGDAEAMVMGNIVIGSTVPAEADLSATARLMWDERNLYLLTVVKDDELVDDSPEYYDDDAVDYYIDIGFDQATAYGSDDCRYAVRSATGAYAELTHGKETGVQTAVSTTSDGYIVEASIPWSTLGLASPAAGVQLGVDAHVSDDDDGGTRDSKIAWYAEVDLSWNNPSLFARAKLVETLTAAAAPSYRTSTGANPTISRTAESCVIEAGRQPLRSVEIFAANGSVLYRREGAFRSVAVRQATLGRGLHVVRCVDAGGRQTILRLLSAR